MSDFIKREDAIEAECSHCGWRSQCEEDSGYWCESGGLIRRDIPSADVVPTAEYRSMENTCYKLQKALYEINSAPSIDIVRCKECEWLRYCETEDLDLYLDCDCPDGGGITRNEEWFCADGERREGE